MESVTDGAGLKRGDPVLGVEAPDDIIPTPHFMVAAMASANMVKTL
jgi:hypothetical protein